MGAGAGRHARQVLEHVERIVAIALLCAAQALDLRLETMTAASPSPAPVPGTGVVEAHRRIRSHVRRLEHDREPGPDLAALTSMVHAGELADLVE